MLGYTSWRQLVIYSYFTCLLSARLFMLLLFSCLFIMLFSYPITAVYLAIILCTLLYARVLLFTHTHQVAFWCPWICTSRYWTLVLLCRCSMRPYILRGAWVSLWFWYSHLSYIPVISWFYLYRIQLPFSFRYSSAIIVLDFICIIAVIIDYYSRDL